MARLGKTLLPADPWRGCADDFQAADAKGLSRLLTICFLISFLGFLAGKLGQEDYQAIQDKKSQLRLQRVLDILLKMKLIRHTNFPENSIVPKSVQEDILVLNTKPYFEQPVRDASPEENEV